MFQKLPALSVRKVLSANAIATNSLYVTNLYVSYSFAIWISLWDIDIVWSRLLSLTALARYKSHYRVVVKSFASGQCGPVSLPGSEQKLE